MHITCSKSPGDVQLINMNGRLTSQVAHRTVSGGPGPYIRTRHKRALFLSEIIVLRSLEWVLLTYVTKINMTTTQLLFLKILSWPPSPRNIFFNESYIRFGMRGKPDFVLKVKTKKLLCCASDPLNRISRVRRRNFSFGLSNLWVWITLLCNLRGCNRGGGGVVL